MKQLIKNMVGLFEILIFCVLACVVGIVMAMVSIDCELYDGKKITAKCNYWPWQKVFWQ